MSSTAYVYDVFISYRHQEPDQAWVRNTLVPRLKAKGLRVCVDYECFRLGALLVSEMARAVEQSRYTLAILSPTYLKSNFTRLENVMAEHLGMEQSQRRLLAVMRQKCDPSLDIRARLWLDMTDDRLFESNVTRLVQELQHGELKMATKTEYSYDLFVTYADADEEWVHSHLLRRLGLPPERVITKRKFMPGHNQIFEFERAVIESHYTVLVISPAYLDDEWARFGGQLCEYFSVESRCDRLIPLLLHKCPLRLNIKSRVPVDCIDKTKWEDELARLAALLTPFSDQEAKVSNGVAIYAEAPGEALPQDSPLYIEREADAQLLRQLDGYGTITAIHGAHGTGKSTLLARGMHYAKQQGATVISVSFEAEIDSSALKSLDSFLMSLAHQISSKSEVTEGLRIAPSIVDSIWVEPSLTLKNKMTKFVRTLLEHADKIVLAMDDVDKILDKPFYGEFFGLLRGWHGNRAVDILWRRLNIIMAMSTHPFLASDDIHQSPFNVGLPIRLGDFSESQIRDLNRRLGSPLEAETISQAISLLGGHPFLIQRALYVLMQGEVATWPNLVTVAAQSEGPFDQYLHRYLELLHGDPSLENAMREILVDHTCAEYRLSRRLHMAGLVRETNNTFSCRYGLYEQFFKRQLVAAQTE